MAVDFDDLASNTEHRRSRDVPPAWNSLIFSDGFPGVGMHSDSLSVTCTIMLKTMWRIS